MRGGAEDGTKGMKGNTRPDRRVGKVQASAEQAAETVIRCAEEGRRYRYVSEERDEAVQRGGERESRKGIGSEQDARLRDTAMKKTEMWSRQLGRDRRARDARGWSGRGEDGQVGPSEKSRAVPRGSRERKGLSRGRDLHIPWGQWDGAMWRHGLSVLFWSRWPGLRSDYGAVALGRWDKRGSEGGSLV